MAGIGFELRRLLSDDSYTSLLKGFLYSTVISAGPWLMSVISLAFLGVFSVSFLGFEERQTFSSTVVYIYAGSLVGTGLLQIVITRYLADHLYQGRQQILSQAFLPAIIVTTSIQLPVATAVLWGAPLSPAFKASAAVGFLVVSMVWQSMIFISATRDYLTIVLAFLLGACCSVAGGLLWGKAHGLEGYLNGFILGQFVILALLVLKITRQYGLSRSWDWGFLSYARRYPQLVGIGLFYNLSIWVDKVIYGLSVHGRVAAERFPTYNQYDSSMFLAFATVVPAMAIFLARSETDFADAYRGYYDDIFFRRPLDKILESKRVMTEVMRRSLLDLCKVQGITTFLFVYFADDILMLVGLSYSQTGMFRFGLLGAFMQILMMFIHVYLLYFDLRGSVLALTLWFLVINTFLALYSQSQGFAYYGGGFAVACLLGLAASVVVLYWRVIKLEYITFAKRRILGQTWSRPWHRATRGGLYGKYRDVEQTREEFRRQQREKEEQP